MTITYDRRTDLETGFGKIRTDHGIVQSKDSPFISSFLNAMIDAYRVRLDEVYDLEKELDISRCGESFLMIWGKVLGEGRGQYTYAVDTSLSNVRIQISSSTTTASDITIDGGGLPLPKGMLLYGRNARVRTIDDTIIPADANGVYVRVMGEQQGTLSIPAGTLLYCDITPSQLSGVDTIKAKGLTLAVTQASAIDGGSSPMPIDVYRYILMKKGESLGLFNEARLQTLMRIPDIVKISVDEYQGGAVVYLDVTLPEIAPLVAGVAQVLTDAMAGIGRSIVVTTPLYRNIIMQIDGEVSTRTNEVSAKNNLKAAICLAVNNIRMGSTFDMDEIITTAVETAGNEFSYVSLKSLHVGGVKMVTGAASLRFNEKPYVTAGGISITT